MPTSEHFWAFGIATATIRVPFFILIGSLDATRGRHFWRRKTDAAFDSVSAFLIGIFRFGRRRSNEHTDVENGPNDSFRWLTMSSSTSKQNTRDLRMRRWSTSQADTMCGQSLDLNDMRRRTSEHVRSNNTFPLAQMWDFERQGTLSNGLEVQG